jgi:outer membrane protein assembly factor BamB
MRKRKAILILVAILAGWSFACLCSIVIGPRLYTSWWQSSRIVDHDFPLQQRWCFEAERNIRSTPVEYNNKVVARTNQDLYVLDATTGDLLWSASLPKTWHAAPPIVRNDVVVVTHTGGTSAFDLSTGEQLWLATDNTSSIDAFPSAADDALVVIVGGFVAGRDIRTDELLWCINRLYPRSDAIAGIDEDYLHVVFRDQIRAYDVETGDLIWTTHTEPWSLQSWLFQDGTWYLEHVEGGLSAFSVEEQNILWRRGDFKIGDYLMAKSGDVLLIGLRDSWPVALNASTGEILWEADGVAYDTYQTPLAMGETVYVRGLREKLLYALDLQTGNVVGYLEIGRPVIVSSNADYSLGPIQVGSSIVFAGDHKLCAYE